MSYFFIDLKLDLILNTPLISSRQFFNAYYFDRITLKNCVWSKPSYDAKRSNVPFYSNLPRKFYAPKLAICTEETHERISSPYRLQNTVTSRSYILTSHSIRFYGTFPNSTLPTFHAYAERRDIPCDSPFPDANPAIATRNILGHRPKRPRWKQSSAMTLRKHELEWTGGTM